MMSAQKLTFIYMVYSTSPLTSTDPQVNITFTKQTDSSTPPVITAYLKMEIKNVSVLDVNQYKAIAYTAMGSYSSLFTQSAGSYVTPSSTYNAKDLNPSSNLYVNRTPLSNSSDPYLFAVNLGIELSNIQPSHLGRTLELAINAMDLEVQALIDYYNNKDD